MKNLGFKIYLLLALGAMMVLGAAAVWMGGLNQDEGWYLYAANMVAEGNMPYRDFFYTQGPLMPIVYSAFRGIWDGCGLLGARIFTLLIGLAGILFFSATARRLAGNVAALITFFLLATNIYHLYYLAIPKTYALAALFVAIGFWLLPRHCFFAGLALAFAAGTRISLGAILAVAGLWLLVSRQWKNAVFFAIGGFLGLGLVYGPFIIDGSALSGLLAAQKYHAARGGFDPVWTVGSFSRLVRWYLPVFILLGLGLKDFRSNRPSWPLLFAFLAVFVVQMLAPFPYEDYQVPIMGLLAVFAAVGFVSSLKHEEQLNPSLLLVLGLCFATSFGSPLLEKWSTNGQDRFWSLKKDKTELAQLREVAREVATLDPGGKELLTQDLYLAIETCRKVPRGLEMGPFAMLSDAEWRTLLGTTMIPIAALSGYSFAIEPPVCNERSIDQQMEYWSLLKEHYELVSREENFGQNATTLLILKRK